MVGPLRAGHLQGTSRDLVKTLCKEEIFVHSPLEIDDSRTLHLATAFFTQSSDPRILAFRI